MKKLGELSIGQRGTIVSIDECSVLTRLLEMGLVEGSSVELVHEAPFGRDPIAVRARGTLIALRRAEANLIRVKVE